MLGIPNADSVPCAGKKSQQAGCHGTNICEAFGHNGCVVLGDDDELENDFGSTFSGAAKKVRDAWLVPVIQLQRSVLS